MCHINNSVWRFILRTAYFCLSMPGHGRRLKPKKKTLRCLSLVLSSIPSCFCCIITVCMHTKFEYKGKAGIHLSANASACCITMRMHTEFDYKGKACIQSWASVSAEECVRTCRSCARVCLITKGRPVFTHEQMHPLRSACTRADHVPVRSQACAFLDNKEKWR